MRRHIAIVSGTLLYILEKKVTADVMSSTS